jgi:dihydroorotase-like cyclic amidohydrolase
VFERGDSASKSQNSPFYGWPLKGRAVMTIVGGRMAWNERTAAADVQNNDTRCDLTAKT